MVKTNISKTYIEEGLGFKLVDTTYHSHDVIMLLKDVSGSIQAQSTEDREKAIQTGTHYSEMLPLEYRPTDEYINIYEELLEANKHTIAVGICTLGDKLMHQHDNKFVIVSLARAGIPIGVLVKRYIKLAYNVDISHYSISIIRGKGIDVNAMEFIREMHPDIGVEHFQFLDGWTGKGAIKNQLNDAVKQLNEESTGWEGLNSSLAVLADPAHISQIYGTQEDIIIPSSCLNSTVTGLVSRTILRKDLVDVSMAEFHGAVYFGELKPIDKTYEFIDTIMLEVTKLKSTERFDEHPNSISGMSIVKDIAHKYGIDDINKIKPGIGEATRVLLRRVPWRIIINKNNRDSDDLLHILRLCEEKHVEVVYDDIGGYKVCGIIKDLSADA